VPDEQRRFGAWVELEYPFREPIILYDQHSWLKMGDLDLWVGVWGGWCLERVSRT